MMIGEVSHHKRIAEYAKAGRSEVDEVIKLLQMADKSETEKLIPLHQVSGRRVMYYTLALPFDN